MFSSHRLTQLSLLILLFIMSYQIANYAIQKESHEEEPVLPQLMRQFSTVYKSLEIRGNIQNIPPKIDAKTLEIMLNTDFELNFPSMQVLLQSSDNETIAVESFIITKKGASVHLQRPQELTKWLEKYSGKYATLSTQIQILLNPEEETYISAQLKYDNLTFAETGEWLQPIMTEPSNGVTEYEFTQGLPAY